MFVEDLQILLEQILLCDIFLPTLGFMSCNHSISNHLLLIFLKIIPRQKSSYQVLKTKDLIYMPPSFYFFNFILRTVIIRTSEVLIKKK